MITIKRDGTAVVLSFEAHIPTYESRVFLMKWEAGNEAYAGLLADRLRTTMQAAVETARREAYEQGWKDAKGKKTKETWFRSWL